MRVNDRGGNYTGRFAPSPTGPLHAGSLVAALASWLDAKAHGGQWLVRMEDIDTPRCLPGADQTILQQLAACGLHPDAPLVYQSKRSQLYQAALDLLIAQSQAYPCGCSRLDIEQAIAADELQHSAEVRFAVEASLDIYRIWAQVEPRERAMTHFSRLKVWDTQANNGVLIYLLLADQSVEILVDREAARLVDPQIWERACAVMSMAFRREAYTEGVLAGLKVIQPALERAFPARSDDRDELPNTVAVL